MATEFRAGRYIRQPNHYAAFMPSPLPPNPALQWDDELQTLLSRADRALGRLDGSIQTLPDLFVFMYVRKEAVLSSQIEGTQSSLNDLLEAEAAISDAYRPSDVGEVLNYVSAMNHGLERLASFPLSVRLIREIHALLLENVRGNQASPGEIRRSQNWIGPGGCGIVDAIFVPPPPHAVETLLSDLEKFIHSASPIPPLVKIGLIHAQFETIHPFLDGNGRIGRLLITFFLCQSEILLKPVLYLSHYFKANRTEYYELLQAVRDRGAWEEWIKFFLHGVATVSLEATETARAIVTLRERHRRLITDSFGRAAGNGLRILESLYQRPYLTVNQVKDYLGISFQSASELVRRMVDADLLSEITGQDRYRVYQYTPYVWVFSEPGRAG
ncbi:MAG: Fic family protein [Sphingobium sp.]|nr:Fic family protein [Sphingobium sp.]